MGGGVYERGGRAVEQRKDGNYRGFGCKEGWDKVGSWAQRRRVSVGEESLSTNYFATT